MSGMERETAWWRGRQLLQHTPCVSRAVGGLSTDRGAPPAPSAMLGMAPLPRYAGEECAHRFQPF
jgi:hypothetical protein